MTIDKAVQPFTTAYTIPLSVAVMPALVNAARCPPRVRRKPSRRCSGRYSCGVAYSASTWSRSRNWTGFVR